MVPASAQDRILKGRRSLRAPPGRGRTPEVLRGSRRSSRVGPGRSFVQRPVPAGPVATSRGKGPSGWYRQTFSVWVFAMRTSSG
jgi:hypothetical protein